MDIRATCAHYEQRQGVDSHDPRQRLAQRLRTLREQGFPGRRLTQLELARALGGVSVPLISSWESGTNRNPPPVDRLEAYARLFATRRSLQSDQARLLTPDDLSEDELHAMHELRQELLRLRSAALPSNSATLEPPSPILRSLSVSPWRFPDGNPITIVCAQLPTYMLDQIPYADIDDPDYVELLAFSDLDALSELHGHIRAANPGSVVKLRVASKLNDDDYDTHMAVLGGTDWNTITRETLPSLHLPIRQVADWGTEGGQYFEVNDGGATVQHRPVLEKRGDRTILREDVALFARGPSPFNGERTVTICIGMYARGTYGAVRALTDFTVRDSNAEYLRSRFGDSNTYCILSRVPIIHRRLVTPVWRSGDYTLFEWSR
jgi:transcriptional regulator with XRE-family HTH domain